LPTLDTSNRYGLVEPLLIDYHGANKPYPVSLPVKTITTKDHFALLEPLLVEYYGNGGTVPVSEPVPTITTKERFALMEPFFLPNEGFFRGNQPRSLDQPIPTITASHGAGKIVTGIAGSARLDIRFRMLKPHELKQAQGFPVDYKILGNTTEQTKQIGNAVPVHTAKALSAEAMKA
jgi:DNA (cytosine-5)-methyltransferase 1